MAFFDDVIVEADIPGYEAKPGGKHSFQTKSLGGGMGQYIISSDGLLLYLALDTESRGKKQVRRKMNFHGDIFIYDGWSGGFVARFSYGKLDWIKPVEEYDRLGYAIIE